MSAAHDPDHLLVSEPRPGVVLLTLNRPEKRNALTNEMLRRLADELEVAARAEARCVVLTGTPPGFCSGGDLHDLVTGDDSNYTTYCELYRDVARAVRDLPCPLIAAVNGAAVAGGFELMCLADLCLAADDAVMFMGDVDHGLPSTSGLSWVLPRLVGASRARWLAYFGQPLSGEQALAIGLVAEVHSAGDVLAVALDRAATIAAKPGLGIGLTRRLIDDALHQTFEETMQAELDAQQVAWRDPQVRAAMDAFLTRRR